MKKLLTTCLLLTILFLFGCTVGDQPPATDINEEAPGRPTDVRAESTLQGINISWKGSGSSNVLIYKSNSSFLIDSMYQIKDDAELIFSGKGSSFLDQNAELNKTYYYLVITNTNSFPSYELTTTFYDASKIENSSLTPNPENEQININWTFPSDPKIQGIEIYRTLGSSNNPEIEGTLIYANNNKAITFFTDQNLTLGNEYCYSFYTIYLNGKKANHESCTTLNHVPFSATTPTSPEITITSRIYITDSRSPYLYIKYNGQNIRLFSSPFLNIVYPSGYFSNIKYTEVYTLKGYMFHMGSVSYQPQRFLITKPIPNTSPGHYLKDDILKNVSFTEEDLKNSGRSNSLGEIFKNEYLAYYTKKIYGDNTFTYESPEWKHVIFMPGIQIIPNKKYDLYCTPTIYNYNDMFTTIYKVVPAQE
jgi:hypothetical protein